MTSYTELGAWQIALWYVVAVVGTAAGWVTFGGQHRRMIADRQIAWLCWHWFTGGPLETSRTFPGLDDDATLTARALRRSGIAGARTAGTVVAGAVWYVNAGGRYGTDPLTLLAAGGAVAVAVAAVTVLAAWAACELAHYLCWIRPLHLAVHGLLGWDDRTRPRNYLTVPRDRAVSAEGVIVGFPPGFDLKPKHKEEVSNVVRGKLDLGDVIETWVPAGRHSYVQYRPRDPMPESCYYKDPATKALVAAAKSTAPVLGITRGGKAVTWNLESESPHLLISAGSGGGKSETVKSVVAQLMAGGAKALMVDFKRHSHRWMNDLPDVVYARDIVDIHHALISVAQEGEQRNRMCDGIGIDEPLPNFQRLVLVCEELTVTMSKLRRWWRTNRQPGDPVPSPAVDALEDIACMGRQVKIHIVAIAQMATAKSIGGSEIRENFPYRCMGRYTKRAWEMLVPECGFTPASRTPGRMQVCVAGVATETQMLLMSDEDALALATGGATVPQRHRTPISQGIQSVAATEPADGELDASPPEIDLVSLRDAVQSGLLVISLSNLRSCRARDPRFPPPVVREGKTDMYAKDELAYWGRNREREIETSRT